MNRDKLKLWVDALRSGRFEQTQGGLSLTRDGVTKFCCLGVLCEVAIADGLDLDRTMQSATHFGTYNEYDGESGHLPTKVREWLGTDFHDIRVFAPYVTLDGDREVRVSIMNDDLNYDFGEIADAVESTYLKGDSE